MDGDQFDDSSNSVTVVKFGTKVSMRSTLGNYLIAEPTSESFVTDSGTVNYHLGVNGNGIADILECRRGYSRVL